MNARRLAFKPPLHIHITTFFIGLVICLGLLLSWVNFTKTSEIIEQTSNQMFTHIAKNLEARFQNTYQPVVQVIDILAVTDLRYAMTLEERLSFLPMFHQALKQRPSLSTLEVGYDNGDFFIVRRLDTDAQRRQFNAPARSFLMVDNISQTKAARVIQRNFYSHRLRTLQSWQQVPTEYDPRGRVWYRKAMKQVDFAVTQPYLYYFMQRVGVTVSKQTVDGSAVIAADITLDQLSDALPAPLTPSSEMVLMSDDGSVLAYHDKSYTTYKTEDEGVMMSRLEQMPAGVLQYLSSRLMLKDQTYDFSFDAERWVYYGPSKWSEVSVFIS